MFKKLNMRGVSHHFLLPILAVLIVAGIGGFIMQRSSSAMTDSAATSTTKTTKTKSCTAITFGRYKNNPANGGSKLKYKPCVKAIQKKVGSGADGIYGNNTQAKVKAWQKNHSLTADGVVGPKTWAAMGIHPKYKTTTTTTTKAASASATTAAKKKACNARFGYLWSSSTCKNLRKVCLANDGTWNDSTKKCTIKKAAPTLVKIDYCDWVKRADYGYDMRLVCRTATVAKGAEYDKLWARNDLAWNTCRSYMKEQHASASPSPETLTRYCQDRVIKP